MGSSFPHLEELILATHPNHRQELSFQTLNYSKSFNDILELYSDWPGAKHLYKIIPKTDMEHWKPCERHV